MEQVLRLQRPVLLFAAALCPGDAQQHIRPELEQIGGLQLRLAAHLGKALAHRVGHAAQAEEVFHVLLHGHLEAQLVALAEAHVHRVLHGGQELDVDGLVQRQREQAGGVGQRGQAVEHLVGLVHIEAALLAAGAQNQAGHHIVPEGIQHAAGVGGQLDGMPPALPGGLDPDDRIVRQHAGVLAQQNVGVVLVAGQGHHAAELLNGGGLFALQDGLPQHAAAPQLNLLGHQPPLNGHVFLHAQVQKAAILAPYLVVLLTVQLILQAHCSAPPFQVRTQRTALPGVGSRKGVVRRYSS